MRDNKLSAYIHVPFCKSKCHYCDFFSCEKSESLIEKYFECLCKEILSLKDKSQNRKLSTVFFGGGTPSYVDSFYLEDVVRALEEVFGFEQDYEMTVECNPGTVDSVKIENYLSMGINRISFGVQSTCDKLLKKIGRNHSYTDFETNIEMAVVKGFKNISADLIFGLPGQSLSGFIETIEKISSTEIMHLSLYSLTLENNTLLKDEFNNDPNQFPDEYLEREMYHKGCQILKEKGFNHYEISNFALENCECRHNLYCWKGYEYYGFGAGAHSYINSRRYSNVNDIGKYLDIFSDGKEKMHGENIYNEILLSEEDKQKEFFLLGFRILNGIDPKVFEETFNRPIDKFVNTLRKLEKDGLLKYTEGKYKLTGKGLDLANKVFVEFI